jgi:O-antigen ligase
VTDYVWRHTIISVPTGDTDPRGNDQTRADGRRRRPLLAHLGLLAAIVPLATSRWGTYIGLPSANIFICDLLLACGLLALVGAILLDRYKLTRLEIASAMTIAAYTTAEFVIGSGEMGLRLRDLAPFLYLASIPVFSHAVLAIGIPQTLKAIWTALWVHTLWAVPVSFGWLKEVVLPSDLSGTPIFSLRKDYDGAVLIAGALFALAVRQSRLPLRAPLALALLSLAAVPALGNRATALGSLTVLMYLCIFQGKWLLRALLRPAVAVVAPFALATLILVSLAAPQMLTSNLLAQRLGLDGQSPEAHFAQGSTFGRRMAWELVWHATTTDVRRTMIGWGPGAEILRDTGAIIYLSGDLVVRAPHNGYLHLFARFGLTGCALWVALLLTLLSSERILGEHERARDALRVLGGALVASLVAAAAVGVILESPFGVLSIYFGLVLARLSRGGGKNAWKPILHQAP